MNKPIISAQFKTCPQDFVVTEIIEFSDNLTGAGEHLWLYVQKIGVNTQFLIEQLAKCMGVPVYDIGYSGLKDRHAVTYQWLSVRLPKVTDIVVIETQLNQALNQGESVKIIRQNWHNKKLIHGVHTANHFKILLRSIKGDKKAIDESLLMLKQTGIPNFFGEQRFGNQENNLIKAKDFAQKILKQKSIKRKLNQKESFLISVMRSFIFNQILQKRLDNQTWDKAITGDVFNLNGTGSVFVAPIDDDINGRMRVGDIHATAPLFGVVGKIGASEQAWAIEQEVLSRAECELFVQALLKMDIRATRRPLRVMADELCWEWCDEGLWLSFGLPAGAFATSLLDWLVQELYELKKH